MRQQVETDLQCGLTVRQALFSDAVMHTGRSLRSFVECFGWERSRNRLT